MRQGNKINVALFAFDREGYTYNKRLAKMGADGSRVSTFCFSIWLHIGQDVSNLAMCISSTFSYKFSFGKPGRTQLLFPHFGKPYRYMPLNDRP